MYTIAQRTYESTPAGSLSLQDNPAVYPVPVITSQEPAEWHIFPSMDNPDVPTYVISKNVLKRTSPRCSSIQLVGTALGVDRYVGTNDANQVSNLYSQRLIQLMFLIPPGCCYQQSRRSSETGHTPMEILVRLLRGAQILKDGRFEILRL